VFSDSAKSHNEVMSKSRHRPEASLTSTVSDTKAGVSMSFPANPDSSPTVRDKRDDLNLRDSTVVRINSALLRKALEITGSQNKKDVVDFIIKDFLDSKEPSKSTKLSLEKVYPRFRYRA